MRENSHARCVSEGKRGCIVVPGSPPGEAPQPLVPLWWAVAQAGGDALGKHCHHTFSASSQSARPYLSVPIRLTLGQGSRWKAPTHHQPLFSAYTKRAYVIHRASPRHFCHTTTNWLQILKVSCLSCSSLDFCYAFIITAFIMMSHLTSFISTK